MIRKCSLACAGLAAILALTACNTTLRNIDRTEFSRRDVAADAMIVRVDAGVITDPADLPATATYQGYADLQTDTRRLLGLLALNADFSGGPGSLTGTVSEVIASDEGSLSGALSATNGIVTLNAFSLDLDGVLSDGTTNTVVDASFSGNFRGVAAEGVLSELVTGTMTTGATVEILTSDSVLVAEQ